MSSLQIALLLGSLAAGTLFLPATVPERDTVAFILGLLAGQLALNSLYYRRLARLAEMRSVAFSFAMAPGTIVHELSHAIAVIALRGSVTRMSLFRPDPRTGVLGQVEYTIPKDGFTTLSALIVGIAPYFGCGAALLGILSLLKPAGLPWPQVNPASVDTIVASTNDIVELFLASVRSGGHARWLTAALAYLALTIAQGAAPSPTDFEGFFQWRGVGATLVALAGVVAGALGLLVLWPAGREAALLILTTTLVAQVIAVAVIESFAIMRVLFSRGG